MYRQAPRHTCLPVALLLGGMLAVGLPAQGGRPGAVKKPAPSKQGDPKQGDPKQGDPKQDKKPVTPPRKIDPDVQEKISDRILRMRSAIRRGMPLVSHVRVKVKLKNSFKMEGVVKNGRLIERPSGLDFVSADKSTPGAGLRLWYSDNTNSYIFLPFDDVLWYRIGARLSDTQVQAIEEKIATERVAANERRADHIARRKALREARERAKEREGMSEEERAVLEEEEKLMALLEEFPPDKGWSEKKKRDIELRKITIGVFPDKESARFLEVFDDWKQALNMKTAKESGLEEPGKVNAGGKETGEPDVGTPVTPPGSAKTQSKTSRWRR